MMWRNPPLLTLAISLLALSGCAGTRAAYKAADSLDEYAAVISEHYAALLEEADMMREEGRLTPATLARLQTVDDKAKPLILGLRPLAEAYRDARDAQSEKALQQALDKAVIALSEFINAVKAARGIPIAASPAPLIEVTA